MDFWIYTLGYVWTPEGGKRWEGQPRSYNQVSICRDGPGLQY